MLYNTVTPKVKGKVNVNISMNVLIKCLTVECSDRAVDIAKKLPKVISRKLLMVHIIC